MSIFIKYHFIFDKYKLKKIGDLAELGLIDLYTTHIIKSEVIKNLKEETAKTRKAINAVFDDGKFLQTFKISLTASKEKSITILTKIGLRLF